MDRTCPTCGLATPNRQILVDPVQFTEICTPEINELASPSTVEICRPSNEPRPSLPKGGIVLSNDTIINNTVKATKSSAGGKLPKLDKMFRSNPKTKISSPMNPMVKERSLPLFPQIPGGPSLVPRSASHMDMGDGYVPMSSCGAYIRTEEASTSLNTEDRFTRELFPKHPEQFPSKGVLRKMKDALSGRLPQSWLTNEKTENDSDLILAQALQGNPKLRKLFPEKSPLSKNNRSTDSPGSSPLIRDYDVSFTQPFADHGYISSEDEEATDRCITQHDALPSHTTFGPGSLEINKQKAGKARPKRPKTSLGLGMNIADETYVDLNPYEHYNTRKYLGQLNNYPLDRMLSQVSVLDDFQDVRYPDTRRYSTPTLPNRQESMPKPGPKEENQHISTSGVKSSATSHVVGSSPYTLEVSGLKQHPNVMVCIDCPPEYVDPEFLKAPNQSGQDSTFLPGTATTGGPEESLSHDDHDSGLNQPRKGIVVKQAPLKKINSYEYKYNPSNATSIGNTLPGLYNYDSAYENTWTQPSIDAKNTYHVLDPLRGFFAEPKYSSESHLSINTFHPEPVQTSCSNYRLAWNARISNDSGEFHPGPEFLAQAHDLQRSSHETSSYLENKAHPIYKTGKEHHGSKSSIGSTKSFKSLSSIRAAISEKFRMPRQLPKRISVPISRPLELETPVNFSKPFRRDDTGNKLNLNSHGRGRGRGKGQGNVKKNLRSPRTPRKASSSNMRRQFEQC